MKRSITCPKCGMTSYHSSDIDHEYCGHCNEFHANLNEDQNVGDCVRDETQKIENVDEGGESSNG